MRKGGVVWGVPGAFVFLLACVDWGGCNSFRGGGTNGVFEIMTGGLCIGDGGWIDLSPPAQCLGNVYVVLPALDCPRGLTDYCVSDQVAYGEYSGSNACDGPPMGYSPACPLTDAGFSSCLVDGGYGENSRCSVSP
jgi:hypothetical protein